MLVHIRRTANANRQLPPLGGLRFGRPYKLAVPRMIKARNTKASNASNVCSLIRGPPAAILEWLALIFG